MNINNILTSYKHLQKLISRFIELKINIGKERWAIKTINSEQISFEDGKIMYSYEYNNSCHCHPEMVTEYEYYSFDEFKEWLKKQDTSELIYDTIDKNGQLIDLYIELYSPLDF